MIRLLYGLTKEAIKAMKRTDLDDVARRLQSTAEDAAGQMGKKSQREFNATSEAVERELYQREARNELAKDIEDDIVQATWETGGWIPGTKNPALFVPEPGNIARGVGSLTKEGTTTAYPKWGKDVVDPGMVKTAKESAFTAYPRWGGQAGRQELPEFTTENLRKISREDLGETGARGQWLMRSSPLDDWWGRRVMSETQPGKYANTKFEDLNQAQQDVYKVIRDMKSYGDLPQELGHPGVLADLLDEAAIAGEKIYRYQGDGPRMFVSNYWRKKGPMIRKEWNTVQETGDVPVGTSFDDIVKGRYNNPNAGD